jgi:hypothetical protein
MSDWIKLRSDLDTDPRIFAMGELLRLSAQSYILTQRGRDLFGDVTDTVTRDVLRDVTICALTRVWFAANRHTTAGVFKNATLDYLDTLALVPGFGQAMATVGYALHDPAAHTVTLPRFAEYNSPNKNGLRSKTKAAERTARYRENKRLKEQGEGVSPPLPPSDPSAPADQKEKESDASRDVTRDVTPSFSSSFSKSTESTPSDSEPVVHASACPASAPPPPDPDPLTTLKKRINTLRPSWTKAPHWSAEEESALFEARHNLAALDAQDWLLLGWFFKWANSSANTGQRSPVAITTRRHQFVHELASYLDRATTAWKQNNCPKLTTDATKPAHKPKTAPPAPADRATAASFADSLKSHGGELPPSRPTTVADHLLNDLGIQPKTLPPPDFNSPAYQALVEATAA